MSTVDIWNSVSLKLIAARPTVEFIGLSEFYRSRRLRNIQALEDHQVSPDKFSYEDYLHDLQEDEDASDGSGDDLQIDEDESGDSSLRPSGYW